MGGYFARAIVRKSMAPLGLVFGRRPGPEWRARGRGLRVEWAAPGLACSGSVYGIIAENRLGWKKKLENVEGGFVMEGELVSW